MMKHWGNSWWPFFDQVECLAGRCLANGGDFDSFSVELPASSTLSLLSIFQASPFFSSISSILRHKLQSWRWQSRLAETPCHRRGTNPFLLHHHELFGRDRMKVAHSSFPWQLQIDHIAPRPPPGCHPGQTSFSLLHPSLCKGGCRGELVGCQWGWGEDDDGGSCWPFQSAFLWHRSLPCMCTWVRYCLCWFHSCCYFQSF